MEVVVAAFETDVLIDQEKGRHADGQTGDVED